MTKKTPNKVINLKIGPDKKNNIKNAVKLIINQYKLLLEKWEGFNEDQRRKIIETNPIIGELLKYFIR